MVPPASATIKPREASLCQVNNVIFSNIFSMRFDFDGTTGGDKSTVCFHQRARRGVTVYGFTTRMNILDSNLKFLQNWLSDWLQR